MARVTPTLASQLGRDVKDRLNRKLRHRTDLPWMKSKELDILDELLDRLAPARCLEWGAGASTSYFPARLPGLERWLSIEHYRPWFDIVQARKRHPAVELVHQPPDHGEYAGTRKEGTLEDFRTYVSLPEARGGTWDFILIDGRARVHCLAAAFRLVDPRGVVALHDANREYYRTDLPPFGHQELFTDWRRNRGGLYLASPARPIGEVLDLNHHRRLWRQHQMLARALFMR
jgi:predicted O-methyltransferase YrrM